MSDYQTETPTAEETEPTGEITRADAKNLVVFLNRASSGEPMCNNLDEIMALAALTQLLSGIARQE